MQPGSGSDGAVKQHGSAISRFSPGRLFWDGSFAVVLELGMCAARTKVARLGAPTWALVHCQLGQQKRVSRNAGDPMNKEPILLILGPSGAGKTTLGDYLAEHHCMLHVNFDQPGDGVDIEHLRKEWNAFLDDRNPQFLADEIRRRIRAGGWKGASITCPSGIVPSSDPNAPPWFLPRKYPREMKGIGLHCVVVYGTREECLAAFLSRDRNLNETYWNDNNSWWYTASSANDFGEYMLQAFNNGHRRELREMFEEIQRRLEEPRMSK